jgi:hypothetical protein
MPVTAHTCTASKHAQPGLGPCTSKLQGCPAAAAPPSPPPCRPPRRVWEEHCRKEARALTLNDQFTISDPRKSGLRRSTESEQLGPGCAPRHRPAPAGDRGAPQRGNQGAG